MQSQTIYIYIIDNNTQHKHTTQNTIKQDINEQQQNQAKTAKNNSHKQKQTLPPP